MSEHASALVFVTERQRAGTGQWTSDHGLVVAFEAGREVPLTRLDWRDEDGSEAVIGFDTGMATFIGLRIAADGTPHEWRGRLSERVPGLPHRFRVEGGDGKQDLSLLIEDGGAPAVRVGWLDREGGGGTVVLRAVDLDESDESPHESGEVTGRVREVRAGNEHTRAGEVALNLLDGTASKWLSWRDSDWLEFTMDEPVKVGHYALVSANDFADPTPGTGCSGAPWTATRGPCSTPARASSSPSGTSPATSG